jgi:uncharacterized protein (DUF58 family)
MAVRGISTSSLLVYAGLLIATVACGLFVNPAAWAWTAGLVAMTLLGVAWPMLMIRAAQVEVLPDRPRGVVGEAIGLRLVIRNTGLLPLAGVRLLLDDADLPLDAVGPLGVKTRHHGHTASRRGQCPGGEVEMVCSFPFGLWTARRAVAVPNRSIIWPAPVVVPPPRAATVVSAGGGAPLRLSQTGETAGLRDYRRGDSPRQIHWAATARMNRFIAQERHEQARDVAVIVLDIASFSGKPLSIDSGYEASIRVVAGMIQGWSQSGMRLTIHVGGQTLFVATPAEAGRAMDDLSSLPRDPSGKTPPASLPRQATVCLTARAQSPVLAGQTIRLEDGMSAAAIRQQLDTPTTSRSSHVA